MRKVKLTDLAIIVVILNCLGFPGNYENIFGTVFGTFVDYFCFAIELVLMFRTLYSRHFRIYKKYWPVFLFIAVITCESLMVTNYMTLQMISCIRLAVTVCFGMWLAACYEIEDVLNLCFKSQVVFLILTMVYMLLDRNGAFQDTTVVLHAFTGLYTTKNACASELYFGFIMSFLLAESNKGKKALRLNVWGILILQAVLLVMCLATGPLLYCVVTVLALLFLSKRRFNLSVVFWAISIGFLIITMAGLPALSFILNALGKDVTLTGRTDMWEQVFSVITSTHTFTGFGYAMFWRDPEAYSLIHAGFGTYTFLGNATSGAHNMILDFWLNAGLFGLWVLAVLIFAWTRKQKAMRDDQYKFIFATILILAFHGLTERSFDPSNYMTLFLFISLGFGLRKYDQNIDRYI